MRVRAPPLSKPRWGQAQLAGRSSNLTSEQGETREQGRDYPPNKRTILGYPLQHGERDGEWELRTAASAANLLRFQATWLRTALRPPLLRRGWACFRKRRRWRLIDGRPRGDDGREARSRL
jgi:hypothetical protein